MKKIIIFCIILLFIFITLFLIYCDKSKYYSIPIPKNTTEIYSSPVTNNLILIIDGKMNMLFSDGKMMEYPTEYNVKTVKYTEKEALVIDDNYNLYQYSFNENKSSKILLQNVLLCDISLDSYAAVTNNGELYIWGNNQYGILGVNNYYIEKPLKVDYMHNVKEIVLNGDYSVALSQSGEVYQCGTIYYNEHNSPIICSCFTKINSLSNVDRVFSHFGNIAIDKFGKITYWSRKYNCNTEQSIFNSENKAISDFCNNTEIIRCSPGGTFFVVCNEKSDIYLWGTDICNHSNPLCTVTLDYPKKIFHSNNIKDVYSGYTVLFIETDNNITIIK